MIIIIYPGSSQRDWSLDNLGSGYATPTIDSTETQKTLLLKRARPVCSSCHLGDVIFNDGLKKVQDARVGNHQRKVNET